MRLRRPTKRGKKPPGPMPRAWFTRLMNAIEDGDAERERVALGELAAIDVHVSVGRSWRKGAART
jgi:hypothetical protein